MKYFFLIFLVFFLIPRCGSSPSSSTQASQVSSVSPQQSQSTATQAKIQVETTTGSSSYATLVPSSSSVPCNSSVIDELIYSKSDGAFYYCTTDGWTQIDIQGPQGPAGATGPQGATGATGPQGTAAQKGNAYWISPLTGNKWNFGRTVQQVDVLVPCSVNVTLSNYTQPCPSITKSYASQFPSPYLCSSGSRSPTLAEYQSEIGAGIWNAMGSKPLIVSIATIMTNQVADSSTPSGLTNNYSTSWFYKVTFADSSGNFDIKPGYYLGSSNLLDTTGVLIPAGEKWDLSNTQALCLITQ